MSDTHARCLALVALHRASQQVVKVADFGVARVKAGSGIMTAETGTYRWMAPEVCCGRRERDGERRYSAVGC